MVVFHARTLYHKKCLQSIDFQRVEALFVALRWGCDFCHSPFFIAVRFPSGQKNGIPEAGMPDSRLRYYTLGSQQKVKHSFPLTSIRYSSWVLAPQLLSPPTPICARAARTTVYCRRGSSLPWAAFSSSWAVQGSALNSIPSPRNRIPLPRKSVTSAHRTPVRFPLS